MRMTVEVKQDDFLKALQEITPSLSLQELERYERIRQQYEGGSKTRQSGSSAS